MARELTEQEKEEANYAFAECEVEGSGYQGIDRKLFWAGFAAALDYRQGQIDELQAILRDLLSSLYKMGLGDDPYLLPDIADARAILAKAREQ